MPQDPQRPTLVDLARQIMSRVGMSPPPLERVPRYRDYVTVQENKPKEPIGLPDDQLMAILAGTQTTPPTGRGIPPFRAHAKLNVQEDPGLSQVFLSRPTGMTAQREAQSALDELAEQYPYLERSVPSVSVSSKLMGTRRLATMGKGGLELSPDLLVDYRTPRLSPAQREFLMSALMHEMVHAGERTNYLDPGLETFRQLIHWEYPERPGEEQAFAGQQAFLRKRAASAKTDINRTAAMEALQNVTDILRVQREAAANDPYRKK